VRAAAVADFLQDLRAHGSADLNGVLAILNDGSLVRETLAHWIGNRWIIVAPNTPLQALAGPGFSRDLTLERFCGAGSPPGQTGRGQDEEEPPSDEDS